MAFGPEDLGGLFYLVVLTPLGTAVISALLLSCVQGRNAG
jgi:hypothetical protein